MTKVKVCASRNYDVIIGKNLLEKSGEYCVALFGKSKALVVTDSNVAPLYLSKVCDSFKASQTEVSYIIFPAGESSKNTENLVKAVEKMASLSLTSGDFVVALGGGVIGDLTGFAAGVYLRGIPVVQMPTTLLSAVDSSVGGKTAVNLPQGKNLMGMFNQPALVLCDIDTLDTLTKEHFREGMAEVIKYGVIFDTDLFNLVKNGDVKADLEEIIARCVTLKRDVVAKDEFDKGERKLLNFGHTMAHAIEKCSNFEISHGNAVAVGMLLASSACYRLGFCKENCTDEIKSALVNNNLLTECDFSADELSAAALSDKKRNKNTVTIVVPYEIGNCILKETDIEMLEEIAKG